MSQLSRASGLFAACLALLLAACAPEFTRPPALPGAPEGFPDAAYRQLAIEGHPVFRVDETRSILVIEAHRGGSLARMGHDHVIAGHRVEGLIAPDDKRADLYVRLEDLVVDEPELRDEAKLTTHPSADDIAGTRRNMLNAFEAERYPFALVHIESNGEGAWRAGFSLHGVTRTQELPARIDVSGDEMTVAGSLALKQTDFGIKPVSVLGGALVVVDEVNVRFSIGARRVR